MLFYCSGEPCSPIEPIVKSVQQYISDEKMKFTVMVDLVLQPNQMANTVRRYKRMHYFYHINIYDETKVSHQSGRPIYARAKYVVILANCLHEKGTAARRIRKNGVTKTDYSVNSMLNYILFARALSSQMSAISIARNNPFFSLDLTSCFLGER